MKYLLRYDWNEEAWFFVGYRFFALDRVFDGPYTEGDEVFEDEAAGLYGEAVEVIH
jgi:hypothetical protein